MRRRCAHPSARLPAHRSPASLAVDEWQTPIDYTRKSDGRDGTRQVVDLTDASRKRVRATIFMKGEERLQLVVGEAIALRATTELWQQRVALKAFYDGVTCSGVAEAEALGAAQHAWAKGRAARTWAEERPGTPPTRAVLTAPPQCGRRRPWRAGAPARPHARHPRPQEGRGEPASP